MNNFLHPHYPTRIPTVLKTTLFFLFTLTTLILSSCNTFLSNLKENFPVQTDVVPTVDVILPGTEPANSIPVCDNNTGETRVLYILADIQLSGDTSYYAQAINDPQAVDAVARWNSGTRVQNLDAFERKIVASNGWQIVYAGTETTICGNDVITTEIQTVNFCNNSYWPIVDGASWTYLVTRSGYSSQTRNGIYQETRTINMGADGTSFTLHIESQAINQDESYECTPQGIVKVNESPSRCSREFNCIWLPSDVSIQPGFQFNPYLSENIIAHSEVMGFETKSVPAGIFQTARICIGIVTAPFSQSCGQISDGGYWNWEMHYAQGVGLVSQHAQATNTYGIYDDFQLESYYIP